MKITLLRNGEELVVTLRGDINESAEDDFRDLLAKIEVPKIVFETEKVELVNSLGARYWIDLVQSLAKRSIKMTFRKCSPAFVESCNMYPKFVPKNSIESLFVVAECSKCRCEESSLLTLTKCMAEDPLSGVNCGKCGSALVSTVDFVEYLQAVRET
jgi:anti-anti-sigma regulatory factor